MSCSASPRPPSGPRRRSLLVSAAGAAGAVLLVGCSGDPEAGEPAAERSAADAARARAGRDSEALAARYAAVIAAHPGLAERLRPLREEVLRHVGAFGAGRAASPGASASSGASPSVSARAAGPGDDVGRVPADEKDAVALLAGAERKLADRRAEALLEVPGELARLLASVAAAGAAHVYLLTDGG
ncbi:hypothetical protein OIE75_27160 [Streptomyces sp. NBC_01723]|uniref:hypothetical protein n=1 Tax=unclassified Streptomyces TaxID=2593676 RepID=UPI0027D82739|nr:MULTISPECIES: hypothetical protein [unclassified Streptomyces]